MTAMNITEEEHLRYINPKLPDVLLAVDSYAYLIEIQHGCHASHQEKDQEKMYCTWIAQLRGEIKRYIARMERTGDLGRDRDRDEMDLETGWTTLNSIASELHPTISGIRRTMTEFLALDAYDTTQVLSVLSVLSEKYDRFRELIDRAEDLESDFDCPQHGLPVLCDLFGQIRKIKKGVDNMLTDGLGSASKHVKEEIKKCFEGSEG